MSKKTSAVVTRTTADKYTLYVVPPRNRGEWELLYLVSLTGTDSPSVFFYDSSTDTEYKIFGAKNIGTGEYLLLTDAIVVMEENDEIRVQNSGTNTVTYVVTVNLIQNIASSYHS
jgi:hypothetical protein